MAVLGKGVIIHLRMAAARIRMTMSRICRELALCWALFTGSVLTLSSHSAVR